MAMAMNSSTERAFQRAREILRKEGALSTVECEELEVLLDEVTLVDESPPVEAVVLGRERMARLHYCLGRMTGKTRDIFLAHRVGGRTYQEIADHHGLSISTVEKHIAKATLQLVTGMEGW